MIKINKDPKTTYFFDFDGVLATYESDYDYMEYIDSCLNLLWKRGCLIIVVSNNRHVNELMPPLFKRYIDDIHHVSGEKLSKIKELVEFYDVTPMECIFYDDTIEHIEDVSGFIDAIHVKSGEFILDIGHIVFKFKRTPETAFP